MTRGQGGWARFVWMMTEVRPIVWALFFINAIGTLWGFEWYWNQLRDSPWYLLPFVPDSPNGSLFFAATLLIWLLGGRAPVLEALAALFLVKYGSWAVGIDALYWAAEGYITPILQAIMLSHAGMVFEAFLFMHRYTFSAAQLFACGLALLANDYVDYLYGVWPWLYNNDFLGAIRVATPLLSLATIFALWWAGQRAGLWAKDKTVGKGP
ncbi:MAG: DUF1405 domain-containing protein [Firmicutes bacterium]|nr:DUF1405 domain-containing protein [Bacillota bacterium]